MILTQEADIVEIRKAGMRHVYVLRLSKAAYEEATLRALVTTVFATPRSLVARLIDDDSLSQDDLLHLKKLLDERITP